MEYGRVWEDSFYKVSEDLEGWRFHWEGPPVGLVDYRTLKNPGPHVQVEGLTITFNKDIRLHIIGYDVNRRCVVVRRAGFAGLLAAFVWLFYARLAPHLVAGWYPHGH